jgi:protein-tyrosine-phosphatase
MRILFVCSGNICRSPMAEALARAEVPGVEFSSAGMAAVPGAKATQRAADAVAELSLDLASHRAVAVEDMLSPPPDRIYVMTKAQLTAMLARFPVLGTRASLLDPRGLDVADPYGQSADVYRKTRDQIHGAVLARSSSWVSANPRTPRRDT